MSPEEYKRLAEGQGEIAARIFQLRQQIDLHLQANNTDAVTKLLCLISTLESQRRTKPKP
jgi:type III secretion system FlhB-like substrate exporter